MLHEALNFKKIGVYLLFFDVELQLIIIICTALPFVTFVYNLDDFDKLHSLFNKAIADESIACAFFLVTKWKFKIK